MFLFELYVLTKLFLGTKKIWGNSPECSPWPRSWPHSVSKNFEEGHQVIITEITSDVKERAPKRVMPS